MASISLTQAVQNNCDISDARDNGIYSICTLVLKLRNQYKWENNIDPWSEPEPGVLLDWIEAKEKYWATIAHSPYQSLVIHHKSLDPWDVRAVNEHLESRKLVYGAGYGRSMKSIFFIAEKLNEYSIEGCPVLVLGNEIAKELSSPLAMLQDGMIYIRREQLRFYFWDQIQEIRSTRKKSIHYALKQYGVLQNGKVDKTLFQSGLDEIVDHEIDMFIYHEIGELMQDDFDSNTLKLIIAEFSGTPIEFVCRALKDILADTHPHGMLSHIIKEKKESSLGFYVGFLDGLRKVLFPEINYAFDQFVKERDWQMMKKVCERCRERNIELAQVMKRIASLIGKESMENIKLQFDREVLLPLGLDTGKRGQ